MGDIPSLFSMCLKTIVMEILLGCDQLEDLFELPSDLLDCVLMHMPPIALQKLHDELSSMDIHCQDKYSTSNIVNGTRKRGRNGDLNGVWKILFESRWPNHSKGKVAVCFMGRDYYAGRHELFNHRTNWQQLYWETHLQNCLDEASETALLPSFNGRVGEIKMSDTIVKSVFCDMNTNLSSSDFTRLSTHCQKFGCYARLLRLQNVLCVAQTIDLLDSSRLQEVVFCNIKSNVHVDGVCNLLFEKRGTLLSLKFRHCKFPSAALENICESICKGETEHGIQHLSFISSSIFENKPAIISSFLQFLSSGRSLLSLKFCETKMGPSTAKYVFDTLLQSSSCISNFEISDDSIAGWFSKANRLSGGTASLHSGSDASLQSLSVLNLRGNNLCKEDMEDLRYVLAHMPKLTCLDLSDNPLMDEGLRNLIPYFVEASERSYVLSEVKIENCSLSGVSIGEMLTALSLSKLQLNSLSIAENDLGRYIARPLASFLGTSKVKELNVEDIGLGQSGFQEFEKELPKNIEIVYINLSKNRGGIDAARFVSRIIMQAPYVVAINASQNFMPCESLEVIFNALKQAKGKLQRLDLTGNNQLYQLAQYFQLESFSYHGDPIVILPWDTSSVAPYDDEP